MIWIASAWPVIWNEYRDQYTMDVEVNRDGLVGAIGVIWNDTIFGSRFGIYSPSGSLICERLFLYGYDVWFYRVITDTFGNFYLVGFISDTSLSDKGFVLKISQTCDSLTSYSHPVSPSYFKDAYVFNDTLYISGYEYAGTRYHATLYKMPISLSTISYIKQDSSGQNSYYMSLSLDSAGNIYAVLEYHDSTGWIWETQKISDSGNVIWSNPSGSGSSTNNQGYDIFTQSNGNSYTVGYYWSSHFNWWIEKWSSSGARWWFQQYGLNGVSDMTREIGFDGRDIWVIGWFDDAPYTWRLRLDKRDTIGGNVLCYYHLGSNWNPRFSQGSGLAIDRYGFVYIAGFFHTLSAQKYMGLIRKFDNSCTPVGAFEYAHSEDEIPVGIWDVSGRYVGKDTLRRGVYFKVYRGGKILKIIRR